MRRILFSIIVSLLWITWPQPDYQLDFNDAIIIEVEELEFGGTKFSGMATYPFIFIDKDVKGWQRNELLAHEFVHIWQQKRDGFLGLSYYLYFGASFLHYYFVRDYEYEVSFRRAYWINPYEKEARKKEKDLYPKVEVRNFSK